MSATPPGSLSAGHDEGDQTPLAADISLWKFFRATGYPPVGASEPDVDRAFDRIVDRATKHAVLVPPPVEVLDALDAWLEAEQPDGVEVTSSHVAHAEKWAKVREYRRALDARRMGDA